MADIEDTASVQRVAQWYPEAERATWNAARPRFHGSAFCRCDFAINRYFLLSVFVTIILDIAAAVSVVEDLSVAVFECVECVQRERRGHAARERRGGGLQSRCVSAGATHSHT